ncbi:MULTISPECIES: PAAR domain-containing protein [unclassified Duganella]|uniref:PAAR domain-containing protein n=1 Tax=unclassified Duganella TaxID=2636909 RepID=UPI00089151A4|nr:MULTISPECIES: PAAR domain-containing protein [unclassified Duganella]SDH49048.1 Zn-binding Pro-Ala-Ala-Arg (PAAR) domain-containing protein, incolved in TypeVI secretion [Duganella sp. OV458]SDK64266.1 Zn-binding Pro-Ala-Ala-Arg (PAAR) domain-containing protein, incolved in TypeVI secretion [Duganella sp. OV510]
MKNSKSKGVIRLGDSTSHGGKVLTACTDLISHGKPVALNGNNTLCPQCKGMFPIQTMGRERIHKGESVAYDGDKTTCGATLISSI